MARKGRKRLAIDIPDEWHKELIQIAQKYNITITKWVWRTLWRALVEERKYEK